MLIFVWENEKKWRCLWDQCVSQRFTHATSKNLESSDFWLSSVRACSCSFGKYEKLREFMWSTFFSVTHAGNMKKNEKFGMSDCRQSFLIILPMISTKYLEPFAHGLVSLYFAFKKLIHTFSLPIFHMKNTAKPCQIFVFPQMQQSA